METPQTKRERFQRLAQKRVNEVMKKLEILGHCGSRQSYEYSPEEAKQIFIAIERKLNDVRTKFKASDADAFSFGSGSSGTQQSA